MTAVLHHADLRCWIETFATTVLANRDDLDELDSATGDGEHGSNLGQGLSAVLALLEDGQYADVHEMFEAIGMTVVNNVGGASGALYGTFFLRFSDMGVGRTDMDLGTLTEALAAGLGGIMELGSTSPGDKTMVDALHPAVSELSAAGGEQLSVALDRAAEAAARGRDATAEMLARVGRGSYLGERSLGHVDAGATSMAALVDALRTTVANR